MKPDYAHSTQAQPLAGEAVADSHTCGWLTTARRTYAAYNHSRINLAQNAIGFTSIIDRS